MYNTVKSAKLPGSCHYLIMSSCHHSFVFNIGSHGQTGKHNQVIRGCPKMMMAFFVSDSPWWLCQPVIFWLNPWCFKLMTSFEDWTDLNQKLSFYSTARFGRNKYIFNMVCSNLTRLCRSKLTLVNILTISEIEHP